MVDNALMEAEARREALVQKIAHQKNLINDATARLSDLQREAADLEHWIEMWHRLAGTETPPRAAERSEIGLPVVKPEKVKRPKNPDREFVAERAVEIIREHGAPMSRRELFDALAEQGVTIRGKDPEMVLSTMLWRSKGKIDRLIPFGYWPAGEPYQPFKDLQTSIDL